MTVFSACCSLKRKIGNKCPTIGSLLFKKGYLTVKDCKKYHKLLKRKVPILLLLWKSVHNLLSEKKNPSYKMRGIE